MDNKIWKIFVSLGVPGLALGVFYMLFRTFNWQFPEVPAVWVGPIIVLFMLLTASVTFYALHRWAPSASDSKSGAEVPGHSAVRDPIESNVELVDVCVIQEDKFCYFPIFDLKMVNRGNATAYLTRIEVVVQEIKPIFRPLGLASTVVVSEQYNVMLDPSGKPGVKPIAISHAILSNEVERIQVKIGSVPNPHFKDDSYMAATEYTVSFVIWYDHNRSLQSKPFTILIPYPGSFMYQPPPKLVGPTLQEKIAALRDGSPLIRAQVAEMLGLIGDERAIPAPVAALKDKNEDVLFRAALALARLGDSHAVPPLVAALSISESEDQFGHNWFRVSEAAKALRYIGDATVIQPLTSALLAIRQGWPVREIIATLGAIGDHNALPPLELIAGDAANWHKEDARRAIAGITDRLSAAERSADASVNETNASAQQERAGDK